MRVLRYAFDEAVRSLWRERRSGALSTAAIAVALFVLGAFLLLTTNLRVLSAQWSSSAEMSIYLRDDISAEDRRAIENLLVPGETVSSHEYVSKADALARFKHTFGDLAAAVESVGDNPLPASIEVRLRAGGDAGAHGAGDGVDTLAARVRQMPGVADVRYDRQWLSRVVSAIAVIEAAGFVLVAILTVGAALTVANVVRLSLHARRDELAIMHLVGAPRPYIEGPFVMEGVLQGGAGAFMALLALAAVFLVLRGRYLLSLASSVGLTSVHFLPVGACLLVVAGGMGVGFVGGLVAARAR